VTRPRVAIVTPYYHPVLGGAEAAAERLAAYLHRRGHDVLVLTKKTRKDHASPEQLDGITVERLGPTAERSGRGKWSVLPAMTRALLAHKREIDVVCCIDYRGVGLAALAVRGRTKAPVIFQAQTEGVISAARVRGWLARIGLARDGLVADAVTWPARLAYGRADAIACISRAIELETLEPRVPRDRVFYLPNPVDTRMFSPASADDRRELRARFQLPPDAVVAAFVGRLSREKGALELITAWAQLQPRAVLVMIGPAMTDHPWDVSADVRQVVERQGLGPSVRLLGGQPTPVVASWLRAADFAVQPSHFEAMGLAAAEEMAAGLPVIASDTGGYRDFIVHDENGLLVPPRDVPALAAAIARLTSDGALRDRLAKNARTTAEAFDETIVLEQFAQLIDLLGTP